MKVFIVYCHPSRTSFTWKVKERFMQGIRDAGHECVLSDLYEMNFNEVFTEREYLRETYYKADGDLDDDVKEEQRKIQESDAIVFIYPVLWTEAPAKLVGWFDRVWTTGFAYNPNPSMKVLEKALFIACAGKSMVSLGETGEAAAMKTVMVGDRIRSRAKDKDMIILDSVTHWDEQLRERKIIEHLQTVYELGKNF